MNKLVLLLSCGAVLVLDATTAMAQSRSDGTRGLEEIIVTARKQEESLRDVPVAVVAIPQIELQNNLATDLSKVAELAPQVLIGRAINGTVLRSDARDQVQRQRTPDSTRASR